MNFIIPLILIVIVLLLMLILGIVWGIVAIIIFGASVGIIIFLLKRYLGGNE
jgi:hypothetical protein